MSKYANLIAFRASEEERRQFTELARAHRLAVSELLRACVDSTLKYARENGMLLPPYIAKQFPPIPSLFGNQRGNGCQKRGSK